MPSWRRTRSFLRETISKSCSWSWVDFHVLSLIHYDPHELHPHPFFSSQDCSNRLSRQEKQCPRNGNSIPKRLQNGYSPPRFLSRSPSSLKTLFFLLVFWTLHLSVRPSTITVLYGFSRFPQCIVQFPSGSVFVRCSNVSKGFRKRHNYLLNLCCSSRCLLPFVASSGKSCPVSYTTSQLLDCQRTYGERKV